MLSLSLTHTHVGYTRTHTHKRRRHLQAIDFVNIYDSIALVVLYVSTFSLPSPTRYFRKASETKSMNKSINVYTWLNVLCVCGVQKMIDLRIELRETKHCCRECYRNLCGVRTRLERRALFNAGDVTLWHVLSTQWGQSVFSCTYKIHFFMSYENSY